MIFNYLRPNSFKRSFAVPMYCIFVVLICAFSPSGFAQKHHCHADELLSAHLEETQSQKEKSTYINSLNQMVAQRGAGEVINIPVVVHVIHQGENIGSGPNLSESKILEQMDILNLDFSLKNTDRTLIPTQFNSLAANTEIQFCLASRDENGNATSGIIRKQMPTITSINNIENTIKEQTSWDPERYMNVWILRMPEPTILGYAYLPIPSILNTAKDGIVLSHTKVGNVGTSTKGRTMVHEVGHYLGLPHIWGFEEDECAEDDQITDTPATSNPYYGCPAYPQFTCGTSDMFMNFMDYVDDNCMHMFTNGQKTIMRNVLSSQRSSLTSAANTICNSSVSASTVEKEESLIVLYPNPCQDVLHITLPEGQEIKQYDIYDNQGRLLKREKSSDINSLGEFQINTTSLQNGVYMVRFETKSGDFSTKRFICIKQ